MKDYEAIANSPALWMFAASVFIVIAVQAVRFYTLARQNASEGVVTRQELRTAMRVGAFSAVGPSLAVAVVALSLIPIFGTPVVLMRIGMVGSVPYELASANAAAETIGTPLGSDAFNAVSFATVFFIMALGAGIWMLQVTFATSYMGKASDKLAQWKPWIMSALTGGALLGAFAYLTVSQAKGGLNNILVILGSGLTMLLLLVGADKFNKPRIKEWALGIAMIAGLIVAAIVGN